MRTKLTTSKCFNDFKFVTLNTIRNTYGNLTQILFWFTFKPQVFFISNFITKGTNNIKKVYQFLLHYNYNLLHYHQHYLQHITYYNQCHNTSLPEAAKISLQDVLILLKRFLFLLNLRLRVNINEIQRKKGLNKQQQENFQWCSEDYAKLMKTLVSCNQMFTSALSHTQKTTHRIHHRKE